MANGFPLVFDGHNDTVMQLARGDRSFFEKSEDGHIDLPRAREGGLMGGFFAVYIIDPNVAEILQKAREEGQDPSEALGNYAQQYADPANWPDPMPLDYAQTNALNMLGTLFKVEKESEGQVKIVRTAAEIEQCIADGTFAIELHFEGAEPLDTNGDALEVFYAAGLRSVGLTHSRRNIFTEGVPFAFPADPDTGAEPERPRQGAGPPAQPQEGDDRPLAHHGERILGCRGDHRRPAGRDPLERLESLEFAAQPDRQADGRDQGEQRRRRAQLPRRVPAQRWRKTMPIRRSARWSITSATWSTRWESTASPSAPTTTAPRCRLSSRMPPDSPKLMQALSENGFSDDDLTKIAHGNWVRVLRRRGESRSRQVVVCSG
ncbi:MAG: membrane dipeptidase [Thermomicrobiales bacterium]